MPHRVREHESESIDGGMILLVAAAVTPDGDVAGYTELELPLGRESPISTTPSSSARTAGTDSACS